MTCHRSPTLRFCALTGLAALAMALSACARHARSPELPTPPAGAKLTADAPPAFDETRLIDIPLPVGSTVRIGIAPETIQPDAQAGVVRYVAVARGISARAVSHESLRCNGGQWRVLARQQPDGTWLAANGPWQDIQTARQQSYLRILARDGMCVGNAINTDARAIERGLRTGGRGTIYPD